MNRSLVQNELISIQASDCKRPLQVPRVLLTAASPWFQKALDKRFKEGQEGALRFPETDNATVMTFLYWLFHGRQLHCTGSDQGARTISQAQLQDVKLWIFADKYLLDQLRDAAMVDLKEKLILQYPNATLVRTIFEDTTTDSPLRQVVLKEIVFGMRSRAKGDKSAGFSTEELEKLMDVPGFAAGLTEELSKYLVRLSWEEMATIR